MEKKWYIVKWKYVHILEGGHMTFTTQDSTVRSSSIQGAINQIKNRKNCGEIYSVYRIKDLIAPIIRIEG